MDNQNLYAWNKYFLEIWPIERYYDDNSSSFS